MERPLPNRRLSRVLLSSRSLLIPEDTRKALLRTQTGECRFFLEAHEELVSQGKAVWLSQTEYCYVNDGEGRQRLVKGPTSLVPTPYETVQPKAKAITLDGSMYVKLQHEVTGAVRVERGPKLVFPEPSEEIMGGGPQSSVQVNAETIVVVRDLLKGTLQLVEKEGFFFPNAHEEIVSVKKIADMVKLEADDYAVIRDTRQNRLRTEEGEQRFFLHLDEELVRRGQAARLSETEYIYVDDGSGKLRLVKGPLRFVPGPYESLVHKKKQAITLDSDMYVKVQDKISGEVRVERGPQLFFPHPLETVVDGKAENAVRVDSETAVLVRDLLLGTIRLVQDHGLFFPRPQDEILSVQKLIRLEDHQAVVMKDESGQFQYFYGSDKLRGDQPRAFFLAPYCQIVEHCWSRGRTRQTRDLRFSHLDMRPKFMNFEFNSRTSDNVELVLEGTFYWQVADVPKMMCFSGDVTGDISNYARSAFIQKISKVTLKEFMDDFRRIAGEVIAEDTGFYEMRGLKVHSLEVTGYHCAEKSTAAILQQMIQETTNRMNRTSQQESENELKMNKIQGEIEQERMKGELHSIQQQYLQDEARAAGTADAERAAQFLRSLETVVPDCQERITMWNTLRKGDALGTLAAGNAHLYFTPSDVNLSIEDRAGR